MSNTDATRIDTNRLRALARENAQIASDFIWAGNFIAGRDHLLQAVRELEQAESATATTSTIEV